MFALMFVVGLLFIFLVLTNCVYKLMLKKKLVYKSKRKINSSKFCYKQKNIGRKNENLLTFNKHLKKKNFGKIDFFKKETFYKNKIIIL